MNLYHAAVYTSSFGLMSNIYARLTDKERELYNSMEHILESYHYIHAPIRVAAIRNDKKKVFLDSGAFSAFSIGSVIDINKYCDYIHENQDIVLHASVLDAIGDPDGTWRNQMEMERQGTHPLPCYHYGEPTEVLDWYVSRYEYITIGGMVPISNPQLKIWLDRIWEEHLTNTDGSPKLKVHGFGLTSPALMAGYPWYSVDSSTWQAMGSAGSIMMTGGFPRMLPISNQAAQRKIPGQHLDTLTPPERAAVVAEIERVGMEIERLQEHYFSRWCWNMWSMPKLARERGHRERFEPVEQRLF